MPAELTILQAVFILTINPDFKKEQNPAPCNHPEFNCQLDPVPATSL